MRVIRFGGRRPLAVNMTPMIDVVFLLVIFFLVSSHLVRQENMMELPLPQATSGEEELALDQPRVTINVREDGQFLLAGRPLSLELLPQRLRQIRAAEGDRLEVRIRVARNVPWQTVEPLLLACTAAGVWNVTWAVYRQGESP